MPCHRRAPPARLHRPAAERLHRVVGYAGLDPLTRKPLQLRQTAPTYDEAEKVLTRLQRQVDEDQAPKSNITLRQAVEQWLEVVELEDTTRDRYEDLIRLYVLPPFGDLPAAKVDAELLERFYTRLHKCREMCAVERAVRWGHLSVNKAAMAIAPSPERTEPDPPDADEAARPLNEARPSLEGTADA